MTVAPKDAPRFLRRRYRRLTQQVLDLDLRAETDEELSERLSQVRGQWSHRSSLVQTAAVVVELADRHLGLRAHPNQILAGLLMCSGSIVELATGEGKTLASLFPGIYWGLAGHGVHMVTANSYLARRDATYLEPVYRAAGLTVGITLDGASPAQRHAAHHADVTYGTAARFGFDYLLDQLSMSKDHQVTRERFAVVVDEADAILLDEATTPLIISGPDPRPAVDWDLFARVVAQLDPAVHVDVDESIESAALTEEGYDAVDELLGYPLFSDPASIHHIDAAVKARFLFQRDRDYLVVDDAIVIVDALTGRRQPARRFQNSIHESLEAKEGLSVVRSQTAIASISVQSLFADYPLVAGTTGTIGNDGEELEVTYGVKVYRVPSHQPVIRTDRPDRLFTTTDEKLTEVVHLVRARHLAGQPVLIGCPSVAESEAVDAQLDAAGIPHSVLNAKNPDAESSIIAQAGRSGAVTVTTAMAGRGVDITLGGWAQGLAATELGLPVSAGSDPVAHLSDPEILEEYCAVLARHERECAEDRQRVLDAGGLLVVGTSRHLSRRSDDQLRGRSGRQGEPGETVFYLSAEDELVRTFGAENLTKAMSTMSKRNTTAQRALSSVFQTAQKRVDQRNREMRGKLLERDAVMSEQRRTVYAWRDRLLSTPIEDTLLWWFDKSYRVMDSKRPTGTFWDSLDDGDRGEPSESGMSLDEQWFADMELMYFGPEDSLEMSPLPSREMARTQVDLLVKRWQELPQELVEQLLRAVLSDAVSVMWRNHMVNMEVLGDSVHWRALAQKNTQVEYAAEAFNMFRDAIDTTVVTKAVEVSHANLEVKDPAEDDVPGEEGDSAVSPSRPEPNGEAEAEPGVEKAQSPLRDEGMRGSVTSPTPAPGAHVDEE